MLPRILSLSACFLLTGCVGIYDNTDNFFEGVEPGTGEAAVIQNYGTPDFARDIGDQTVYTYKVRDNKYIVLVGLYEGHDLIILCEDGEVVETDKVTRPKTFTFLQPVPWAEGAE